MEYELSMMIDVRQYDCDGWCEIDIFYRLHIDGGPYHRQYICGIAPGLLICIHSEYLMHSLMIIFD